jgi:hypothetical protein
MIKIRRHKWFPFIVKEVILQITPDSPLKSEVVISGKTEKGESIKSLVETEEESYEQPLCNNWSLHINKGKVNKVKVNYD